MPANLATASIKALGHTGTRTQAAHLGDVVNVKGFGAVGDGVADDTAALQAALDLAFNQPAGNGIDWHLNKPVFIPAGDYKTSAPLTIFNTWGAHVYGAGMMSTQIRNESRDGTGEAVLALNGVGYSLFENMRLMAAADCIALDYNWDGTGAVGGQLNTFYKMGLGGIGGHGANAYGCRVGEGGWQCDTSSWIDCLFGGDIGLGIRNLNAISHRVSGGNFQGCRIGIDIPGGSVQEVNGVGFQQSSEWDIKIGGGAGDATHISGVSTESPNFVRCSTLDCAVTIIGCGQRGTSDGIFAEGAGVLNIEGCMSKGGSVESGNCVTIRNSQFWRIDALDSFAYYPHSLVKLENTFFGLDVGSAARREIDTIITAAGKRQRAIEGTSLTANSVVNGGVWTGGNITTFSPVAISLASPAVFSSASWFGDANRHGFKTDTCIAFTTTPNGDTLPTGITTGTAYYVLAAGLTDYVFRLSASPGGAAINCSGSQSGDHSIYLVRMFAVGDEVIDSSGATSGWVCVSAGHALGDAVFRLRNGMAVTEQTDATYLIEPSDGGNKIRFNRATGQTVTVPTSGTGPDQLLVGTRIEVQQVGAGQTTFVGDGGVTIRSSNGLKLRAQYSCATLTCDDVNTWTLSGDTHL